MIAGPTISSKTFFKNKSLNYDVLTEKVSSIQLADPTGALVDAPKSNFFNFYAFLGKNLFRMVCCITPEAYLQTKFPEFHYWALRWIGNLLCTGPQIIVTFSEFW